MSPEIRLLEAYERAIRENDVEGLLACFADHVEISAEGMPEPLRGRETLRPFVEVLVPAVDEFNLDTRFSIQEGPKHAYLVDVRGTLNRNVTLPGAGELQTAGKPFDFEAALFAKVDENGKITWLHRVRDNWRVMRQFGLTERDMEKVEAAVSGR